MKRRAISLLLLVSVLICVFSSCADASGTRSESGSSITASGVAAEFHEMLQALSEQATGEFTFALHYPEYTETHDGADPAIVNRWIAWLERAEITKMDAEYRFGMATSITIQTRTDASTVYFCGDLLRWDRYPQLFLTVGTYYDAALDVAFEELALASGCPEEFFASYE